MELGWVAGEGIAPEGAQKPLGFDLATGAEIARIPFDDVSPRDTSFLNDLVVDEKRGLAILTDSGNRGGAPVPAALIVVDLKAKTARRVLDSHPALSDDPERCLIVDGVEVFPGARLAVGVNGITLSADGETLWFSMTTSGAWPAPRNFGHTAVGISAIRRWQRLVCWQDRPEIFDGPLNVRSTHTPRSLHARAAHYPRLRQFAPRSTPHPRAKVCHRKAPGGGARCDFRGQFGG